MPTDFNISLLNKKWIHSHEEDHGHEIVYRPSTYKFPPSRGRASFEMEDSGSLTIGGPAPDDRQLNKKAQWKIEDNVLVFRNEDAILRKLRILSFNSEKLIVADQY